MTDIRTGPSTPEHPPPFGAGAGHAPETLRGSERTAQGGSTDRPGPPASTSPGDPGASRASRTSRGTRASRSSRSSRGTRGSPKPRRRRWGRRLAAGGLAVALAIGVPTAWALNRFVIDHVQIADVAAYEAAQAAQAGAAGASTDSGTSTDTATDASADTGTATDSSADSGTSTDNGTATDSNSSHSSSSGTSTAVVTDDSYTDSDTAITITKVVTGSGEDTVTYYVADVVLDDATQLRSAFAHNAFGTNIVEHTSDIAEDNDAIFAINGDYYGFRDTGIVIRNGVVYRDSGARAGLAIYRDGTMKVYDETQTTAAQLVAEGVWNTLSFGPALVSNGSIVSGIDDVEVDTNFGNHSVQGSQPRTGIGIVSAHHYVLVVVDGRSPGYSKGVTMSQFAQIFADLGATTAYNLDGGGSSTMYFDGDVVNDPLGRGQERGTSDILYVG